MSFSRQIGAGSSGRFVGGTALVLVGAIAGVSLAFGPLDPPAGPVRSTEAPAPEWEFISLERQGLNDTTTLGAAGEIIRLRSVSIRSGVIAFDPSAGNVGGFSLAADWVSLTPAQPDNQLYLGGEHFQLDGIELIAPVTIRSIANASGVRALVIYDLLPAK